MKLLKSKNSIMRNDTRNIIWIPLSLFSTISKNLNIVYLTMIKPNIKLPILAIMPIHILLSHLIRFIKQSCSRSLGRLKTHHANLFSFQVSWYVFHFISGKWMKPWFREPPRDSISHQQDKTIDNWLKK
jgi:hypothetical protein